MADEHEGDGDRPRDDEAAAFGQGHAAEAHVRTLRSAGVAPTRLGKAGRDKQGRHADNHGLGEEHGFEPAELGDRAADDGTREEADARHAADEREGASPVLDGHGLGHVGEARDVPEREGDAVQQREEAQCGGTAAEPHRRRRNGGQHHAGRHGDAPAEAAHEEAGGNIPDHRAGAAGGEDDAAEKDARPEFVGELGDGGDDHPLADAEEEGGQIDAADQRTQLERLRLTGDDAHWGSLRGQGEGRRGIVYAFEGFVGAWRSLVAHLTGGQEVIGSNPVAPTSTTPY